MQNEVEKLGNMFSQFTQEEYFILGISCYSGFTSNLSVFTCLQT